MRPVARLLADVALSAEESFKVFDFIRKFFAPCLKQTLKEELGQRI